MMARWVLEGRGGHTQTSHTLMILAGIRNEQ